MATPIKHSADRAAAPAVTIHASQDKQTALHSKVPYVTPVMYKQIAPTICNTYKVRYVQRCRPQQPQPFTWLWEHVKFIQYPARLLRSIAGISRTVRHNLGLLLSWTAACLDPPFLHHQFPTLQATHPQPQPYSRHGSHVCCNIHTN
jgi:hypothetical protein